MTRRRSPPSHSIDISEEDGVRYLHFGSDWVQGAMRVARPWSLELAYTREMLAGLILRPVEAWPRRILQIGLGAGSLSKFLYRHLPDAKLTVVEINPQVEFVARQYFKLPDDPQRLRVVIADAVDYMLKDGPTFDWILLDGFDADGRAGALDTQPFLQACRARLEDGGLFAVNLLGRDRGFKASQERLQQVFDRRVLTLPSCDSGNTIALASLAPPVDLPLDTLRERAETLRQSSKLDLRPTLTRLQLSNAWPDGRLRF